MEKRSGFRAILNRRMPEGPLSEELSDMKLKPTYENAISLQLVKKAAAGDVSVAKYVLEAAGDGEGTTDGHPLEELSTEELRKMLKNCQLNRR